MALNSPAWLLSNAFTKATADEFGAVKGAPCTVGTVSFDADGNTVVELVWTNTSGASRTTPVTIKKGLGIKSVSVDADEHLILTMTDNTTIDAGEIPKPDLSGYAKKIDIPTKVEDLDDAADYAKKSEIPEGSVVDEDLSETSKNPVQNKTITAELKKKVDAEVGKGLSTNDYDDDAVAEVAKIKDKVDAETGKSLVSDTDIVQITTNKNAIDILNGDDTTEGSVAKQLKDALGDITEFDIKVVATLPATGEKGVIYFVPKDGGTDPDVHDEYVWVGTKFELIGNTKVDLSDYIAKTDISTSFGDTPSDEKIPSEKLVSDTLTQELAKKVDIQQDVAEKGKALVVGEDGKLILGEVATDGLEVVRLTKAEYEALSEDEKNDKTKLYDVYDEEALDLTDYATKEYVNDSLVDLMKTVYPVGSVYISVNNVNPSTFISGTTWERLAKGRTLWNVEDSQSGGDLISAGIPNITGSVSYGIPSNNAIGVTVANGAFTGATPQSIGVPTVGTTVVMSPSANFTASRGETKTNGTIKNDVYGKSDTVQPPSIGVYMWKRTA